MYVFSSLMDALIPANVLTFRSSLQKQDYKVLLWSRGKK